MKVGLFTFAISVLVGALPAMAQDAKYDQIMEVPVDVSGLFAGGGKGTVHRTGSMKLVPAATTTRRKATPAVKVATAPAAAPSPMRIKVNLNLQPASTPTPQVIYVPGPAPTPQIIYVPTATPSPQVIYVQATPTPTAPPPPASPPVKAAVFSLESKLAQATTWNTRDFTRWGFRLGAQATPNDSGFIWGVGVQIGQSVQGGWQEELLSSYANYGTPVVRPYAEVGLRSEQDYLTLRAGPNLPMGQNYAATRPALQLLAQKRFNWFTKWKAGMTATTNFDGALAYQVDAKAFAPGQPFYLKVGGNGIGVGTPTGPDFGGQPILAFGYDNDLADLGVILGFTQEWPSVGIGAKFEW